MSESPHDVNVLATALDEAAQEREAMRCVAGCMVYDGGERRHHKDCGYYPESMSKITDSLRDEVIRLRAEVERLASDALELIAAPKRPDGTYNRSREACEQIARTVLGGEGGGSG